MDLSQEQCQRLVENLPDSVLVVDESGAILYEDPSVQRVTGYILRDDIEQNLFEHVHPSDRQTVRNIFTETSGSDDAGTVSAEFRYRRGDGSWIWLEARRSTQMATILGGYVVSMSEITATKEREERLEQTTTRLELAIQGANIGVWDWDMTTDEVEYNDQWAEMLGHTLDEIDPHLRAWETRVHPNDLDDVKAALDAHIRQRTEYYDTEHRMRTADGGWKWVRDVGKITERDTDDDPIRAVGIHLDVDESRQYQRELEQKTSELEELTSQLERQYQTLFEEAPVMAVVTRAENGRPVIEDCNTGFADTLEVDKERLTGTELAEYYTPDSQEALLDDGGYKRSLEGEFTREPRELIATDGEVVETLLRAVPRRDASDEIVGTVAMYIDVTEREEVKRANERLEEFVSIVSHDLRNPLNVATGHLELAQDTCESPHLDAIEQAHSRMTTLIEDLLRLARQGEAVSNTKVADLAPVVETCWETVETGDASLVIEADRTVVANASRLKQLFENLIRNAVEHGGDDVTVAVGGLDDGFYIEDDGPGISDDDRESVFEPGYSTHAEGTGFGLSIVQRIAEAHGWDIRVTSGTEGGARFEVAGVESAESTL